MAAEEVTYGRQVDTERFRRLRRAVEHALDTHLTLEAEQVRAILSAADRREG